MKKNQNLRGTLLLIDELLFLANSELGITE
jgi:hypothetical protein